MNANDQDRLKLLLRESLPPVEDNAESGRDLWPAVLRKLDARSSAPPWYDWALAASLVLLVVCFPKAIPVFLYYL
jgi:hypothetical protein